MEIVFLAKDAPAQIRTVDELERHSSGRRARRDGAVAVATQPTADDAAVDAKHDSRAAESRDVGFPRDSLHFGEDAAPFAVIARSAGGGWDIDTIAQAYRASMGERLDRLRGAKLKQSWKGFCESYRARRGAP
jgi:hypothetical protein